METSSINFFVDAQNVNTYVWQKLENGSWIDLINNAVVSGVSTNTLNIDNPSFDWNNSNFRCQLFGCNNSISDSVVLQVILGIEFQKSTSDDLIIFPNPISENINLLINSALNSANINIQLFDLQGLFIDEIFDGTILNNQKEISFDASRYSSGYYILRLISDSNRLSVKNYKVIIEN